MGVFIFILHYIIAFILLHHIFKCIYIKGDIQKDRWGQTFYFKTDLDKRLKHPLWLIILFLIIFLIPIANIIIYLIYILVMVKGEECKYNPYYIKSMLTKEY